jgi:hypothetical protein
MPNCSVTKRCWARTSSPIVTLGPDGSPLFGRMIREARIHFAAVIEEARIAGLDTSAIAAMLGKLNIELADSIRPELWAGVEQLLAERAARKRSERRGRR